MTTSTTRYFTKDHLVLATKMGNERGFNRQLDLTAVEALDDDLRFPVIFSMAHEHIAGRAVEPHIRAMIVLDLSGARALLDVDAALFNALPTVEVPDAKGVSA